MEEEQQRLQKAAMDVMDTLDRRCLRTLQIQMHQCAIDCCKDTTNNIKSLETCTNNCSKELVEAQNYVQNEFNKWQQRIQRCVQDCSDAVTDKMPSSRNHSDTTEMTKYIKEAEACASKCFNKHIQLLPKLTDKIVDNVSNKTVQY